MREFFAVISDYPEVSIGIVIAIILIIAYKARCRYFDCCLRIFFR